MSSETLSPATVQWTSTLPSDVQPTTIAKTSPGIANTLAAAWGMPEVLKRYVNELLVDKRGGRRGLPIRASRELHALRAYYATLHRDRDDVLEKSPPR